MGQILGLDNIPTPAIVSSTTITLASTYLSKPTRITIGGQQYSPSALLTMNAATTGLNGLDTGALASNTLYILYAVVTAGGVLGLVAASSAAGSPSGFINYREIGRFKTAVGSSTIVAIAISPKIRIDEIETQSVTVTGAWVANTTYNAKETRLRGNWVQYEVVVATSGIPTAANLVVNLPSNRTIRVSDMPNNAAGGDNMTLGTATILDGGSADYPGYIGYNTTTQVRAYIGNAAATYAVANSVNQTTPFAWNNGDFVYMRFTLPIEELFGLYT